MKKFIPYRFQLFLKCWLFSLAYQATLNGQAIDQMHLLSGVQRQEAIETSQATPPSLLSKQELESLLAAVSLDEHSDLHYAPEGSYHIERMRSGFVYTPQPSIYEDSSYQYAPAGSYNIEKVETLPNFEETLTSSFSSTDSYQYAPEGSYKIEKQVPLEDTPSYTELHFPSQPFPSNETLPADFKRSDLEHSEPPSWLNTSRKSTPEPLDADSLKKQQEQEATLGSVRNYTKVMKKPLAGQQIGCKNAEEEMKRHSFVAPVVGFAAPVTQDCELVEEQNTHRMESQPILLPQEESRLIAESDSASELPSRAIPKPIARSNDPLFSSKKEDLSTFSRRVQEASKETEEQLGKSVLRKSEEQQKDLSEELAQNLPLTVPHPGTRIPTAIETHVSPLGRPTPAQETTTTTTTTTVQEVPIRPVFTQPVVNPSTSTVITPEDAAATVPAAAATQALSEISVNFNNVSMIEFIRFMSRISNKNFIFDEFDLQFNVTIISQEPTSIENLMSALMQELKIRDLALIEQGNNIIIHRNPRIRAPGHIVTEGVQGIPTQESEIVTFVFRLNTLDPIKAAEIIKPLLSDDALIEVLRDSNNLIITDLVSNVSKISQLVNSLDAPQGGMTIGQYAVQNAFVENLVDLADRLLQPIAQGNPYVLVPHPASHSIYIVSNPFLVERGLGILQHLDLNDARTKVLNLEQLRLSEAAAAAAAARRAAQEQFEGGVPGVPLGPNGQPLTGGISTEGQSAFGPQGAFPEPLMPGGISSGPRWMGDLPAGHIERTLFFIHKLKYRKGDQIEIALRKIADSLQFTGTSNEDLVSAINSIQWIESSNSLIFTGTALALDKVRELISEIDIPLRQVFIEMLILDTTINDSLSYGVDWGTRFGGPSAAGAQGFFEESALITGLDTAGITPATGLSTSSIPDASGLARLPGFSLGVIGRHLTHGGLAFNSIGALVRAVHDDGKTNIILNPKIITEDNNTAEIFVGSTTRYKTQSISNDLGTVLTNNYQFLDVGTTLRVTPLIGNNNIITLEIVEEITSDAASVLATNALNSDVALIPVLNKNKTVTKIHVPNGYFVVLSGMMHDTRARTTSRIPCLGGIPLIGAVGKRQGNREDKRNLMIFIRPLIIDTDEEFEYITKRQQDVFREKSKQRRSWNFEIDEGLNFINVKPTDPDEIGCTIK